jgi:hypothetical protein
LLVLFFVASVFMLFAGDDFILQVTGVFARIRSGVTLAADCGDAYRSNLLRDNGGGGDRGSEGHKCRSIRRLQLLRVKNPKGLTAYLQAIGRRNTDRMDKRQAGDSAATA